MSYILEALKKSEQERGAGESPSVQTIHSAGLQYAQQKKPLWPYILAVVITLNVIALIVFFAPATRSLKQSDAANPAPTADRGGTATVAAPVQEFTPSTPLATPPVTAKAPRAKPPVQPPAQPPAPPRQQTTAAAADKTVTTARRSEDNYQPSISKKTRNDYVSVVDVRDLPLDIQAGIPDMVFSAHVYSSNPQQRSVVINGNFMEQGDSLTSKLRLDEITPGGVVFDFDGVRFRTSVLSNWKID